MQSDADCEGILFARMIGACAGTRTCTLEKDAVRSCSTAGGIFVLPCDFHSTFSLLKNRVSGRLWWIALIRDADVATTLQREADLYKRGRNKQDVAWSHRFHLHDFSHSACSPVLQDLLYARRQVRIADGCHRLKFLSSKNKI